MNVMNKSFCDYDLINSYLWFLSYKGYTRPVILNVRAEGKGGRSFQGGKSDSMGRGEGSICGFRKTIQ